MLLWNKQTVQNINLQKLSQFQQTLSIPSTNNEQSVSLTNPSPFEKGSKTRGKKKRKANATGIYFGSPGKRRWIKAERRAKLDKNESTFYGRNQQYFLECQCVGVYNFVLIIHPGEGANVGIKKCASCFYRKIIFWIENRSYSSDQKIEIKIKFL